MAPLPHDWTNQTTERERLEALARELCERVGSDACDLFTSRGSASLVLAASTDRSELVDRIRLGREVGLVGKTFAANRTIPVASGLTNHPDAEPVPEFDDNKYESARLVPFRAPDFEGLAMFRRAAKWPIDEREDLLIEQTVGRFAALYAGFKSGYAAGSNANKLDALSEVARSLTVSPYLEEVLQLFVNLTAKRFNYRVVTVRLLDNDRQELILRATQATNKAYQRKRAIKLGESIAGRAIETKRPIFIEDVLNSPDYIGHDLAEEQGLRSMICIPLIVQDRPVGVMSCYTGEVRQFSDDEVSALQTLAQQTAVSIEHSRLQVRHTLMQEMHHRVKNNLQQVASLLRLQLRQSHYKSLEDALNDSLYRIQAIAAVHELLSRDDLDHVSIRHIAETLGHHQQHSFAMPGKRISFSIRGDDVFLNTNQATQVALIINEMIQNAVEHGFKIADSGEIHVTVEDNEGEIGLWVSNDGDPLPEGFDDRTSGQLGLQIIRSLSAALGGTFKIESRLGWTVCEVKFIREGAE